jgi:hypothetical protein
LKILVKHFLMYQHNEIQIKYFFLFQEKTDSKKVLKGP